MLNAFIFSLNPKVSYLPEADKIILQFRDRKLTFKQPTNGLRLALNNLKIGKEATKKELIDLVRREDGICGLFTFNSYLQKLISLGWICHSVDGLTTAIPLAEDYQFLIPTLDWQKTSFTLSRFAYFHQVKGQMVLESPLSKSQILLHDSQSVAIIAKLAQSQTYTTLLPEFPTLTEEKIKLFLSLLVATHMVDDNFSSQAEATILSQWDFHDLLFHSRSRKGRHNQPTGATYRFKGEIQPFPAVKSSMSSKTIKLYQPNIKRLKAKDISLTEALETRRSIRNYAQTPINAKELGEFFYRSARVRQLIQSKQGEYTSRPYPSGGGLYELELYPLINNCQGINPGFYHYDPLAHQLCLVSELNQDTEKILKDAWYASGQQDRPQILITIAARFGRLSWKYESIAYSLILKHVGVLYQTMYLVATAMNLAPCALGSGNADLFTKVAGTNYYAESSVGEFILGGQESGVISNQ